MNLNEFHTFTNISHWIYRIWTIAFALLGIPGNLLALIIFSRWASSLSIYIYFSGLCIVNLCIILFDMMYYHLYPWIITDQFLIDDFLPMTCRFITFLTYFFRYVFIWFVTMINLDRCFYLTEASQKSILCRQRSAVLISLCLTLLSFLANSHFLFFSNQPVYTELPLNDSCPLDGSLIQCRSLNEHYQYFIDQIWPIYNLFLFALLPMVIIIICGILILRNIYLTRKDLEPYYSRRDSNSSRSSRDDDLRSIAKTLIFLDLLFPLTIFPVFFCQIYLNYSPPTSCQTRAIFNLIFSIATSITYTKNIFAFFIYYSTGKRFRRAFSTLIYCRIR